MSVSNVSNIGHPYLVFFLDFAGPAASLSGVQSVLATIFARVAHGFFTYHSWLFAYSAPVLLADIVVDFSCATVELILPILLAARNPELLAGFCLIKIRFKSRAFQAVK